jgi:hypothetical protein
MGMSGSRREIREGLHHRRRIVRRAHRLSSAPEGDGKQNEGRNAKKSSYPMRFRRERRDRQDGKQRADEKHHYAPGRVARARLAFRRSTAADEHVLPDVTDEPARRAVARPFELLQGLVSHFSWSGQLGQLSLPPICHR